MSAATVEHVEHDKSPEELVAQWRPWIIRKCGEILGPQTWLWDDAEQEAMLRFWQRIDAGLPLPIALHSAKQAIIDVARGRRMTGSISHGGHVDTHNKAVSLVRKSGTAAEEYVFEPPAPAAEQAFRQVEVTDALEGALATLPARWADPIRAVYIDGDTMQAVATREGVSHAAVSHRIKKGMAALREHLGEP